jgi:DNA-binding MarR family transcriptional regulator
MVREMRSMPFLWQDKNTMRLIREAFQEERGNKLAFAIAVYVSLTEIASNRYNDATKSTITQNELAKMTGLSLNTVNQIIEVFERLNIVTIVPRFDERDTFII